MKTTSFTRGLCVAILAFDSVLYAWWVGLWPGVGWIVAAIVTAFVTAKISPEE